MAQDDDAWVGGLLVVVDGVKLSATLRSTAAADDLMAQFPVNL